MLASTLSQEVAVPGRIQTERWLQIARRKVQGLLPSFDAGNPYEATVHTVSTNPCLLFSDLIGEITRWVPNDRPAGVERFVSGVSGMVGRVAELASMTQCLYEADRLAIKVYQHKDFPWSIGIVAVVRGDLEAVGTAAA